MENINFDYSRAFITDEEVEILKEQVMLAHWQLHTKKGPGCEYTGWLDYECNEKEFEKIKICADKVRKNSDVFVVIGIGGSYLGSRATIEALNHSFNNVLAKEKRNAPQIFFAGNNMSSTYIRELFDALEDKDISINVISKSGTTTEPAIVFRLFREYMEKKYGKEKAKERIFVTTDSSNGLLRIITNKEEYESFVIPNNIGGRYSVFSPVGLFPIAVAGIDIDELIKGLNDGIMEYSYEDIEKNCCYQYALVRNALYRRGKDIEILVSYEPYLYYLQEWWKQLFGESEGKDNKGLFPASANFTTDLHSLGQLIQDGRRNIFETVINIEVPKVDIEMSQSEDNIDELNFLDGKTIDFVNKKAFEGTMAAHVEGGVPNLVINVPEMNEYYFGKLIYFFEKACGISGYVMGVNPFNQPGVEKYKKNMFKLIGKPGY